MHINNLQQEIHDVISEIDCILSQGLFTIAKEGYPTIAELEDIRMQLHRIENELAVSRVPPKKERNIWIGRIITDGWWNYKGPLVDKLLLISDMYLRKLP